LTVELDMGARLGLAEDFDEPKDDTGVTDAEIAEKWQRKLAEMEELDAYPSGAALCRLFLRDLDLVRAAKDERLLSLREAAVESGYHVDSLSRLVRQGRIPNAGRKHRPRVRPKDLPRRPKPESIAKPSAAVYDPVADARSLASRRKGAA
jgi:hypothetical protein